MPAFQYRGKQYEYEVNRRDRKTLGIYVHPDLRIEVRAPRGASEDAIEEKVHKRRRWIVRQQQQFEEYHPLRKPPIYHNGATHLYLGRQYRLKSSEGLRNSVKLSGGYLEVIYHPASSPERALESWYKERADYWFPRILAEVFPRFRSLGIPEPVVVHKRLQKRWGSCKVREGRILLNTELIQAPKVGIEYVIAHELTHFLHPHHDHAFYGLMDRVVPEWREWKGRLERRMA